MATAAISHALQFDGNGGTYVDAANPTGLPTGMSARTLAAWFKLASADEDRVPEIDGYGPNSRRAGIPLGLYEHMTEIVGYGPNAEGRRFGIMLDGDRIRAEGCVRDTAGPWIPDTNWHHVAAVVPEHCTHMNQVLVYLDGERMATTNHIVVGTGPATTARWVRTDGSARFDTAGGPLKIGGIPTVDYAYAFNGSLSEVRIYDCSLSPAEIAVLHDNPQRATNRGLVAGYHFDEGHGTTVADFSGRGNNGTLHGGVKWLRGADVLPSTQPPAANAPHPRAVQFDGRHYAKAEPPPKFTSGDFTISLWLNPVRLDDEQSYDRPGGSGQQLFAHGFAYHDQPGDVLPGG